MTQYVHPDHSVGSTGHNILICHRCGRALTKTGNTVPLQPTPKAPRGPDLVEWGCKKCEPFPPPPNAAEGIPC